MSCWLDGERLPVALIDRCTGILNEPMLPFLTVWAVPRGSRSARFALPWCMPTSIPGEPQVLVRRLPDDIGRAEVPAFCGSRALFCDSSAPECVEDLASMIVAEREHQPLAVVMADVLGQPGLHADTRHLLVEMISDDAGVALEALVPEGFSPWTGGPYELNAVGGVTYIAREGRYWRRGRPEQEFTPVTNFVLLLVDHHAGQTGKVTHTVRLEIGGDAVNLALSSAALNNAKRLLAGLVDAAVVAGAELPVISDRRAKRLLPELLMATQRHNTPTGK